MWMPIILRLNFVCWHIVPVDANLIEAYREERIFIELQLLQVFHIPFDEVTPLQRRNAKAVNFGIVYGISSFGLSEDLSIGRKRSAKYIEDYYKTYPGNQDISG